MSSSAGTARRIARDDALAQYLREIAAYPLLTRDEERRLARCAAAGDEEAVGALVRANLRFVVSIAKRYQSRGVPLLDLIEEGNLGLLRAARRFDPEQGVRFISYAVSWIRQAVLHALAEQSRIVRLPTHRRSVVHRIHRQADALAQTLGRTPTHAEIAEELALTETDVDDTLRAARAHVSLDAPVAPGAAVCVLDRLALPASTSSDARLLGRALRAAVDDSLGTITAREACILRRYFGLAGEEPMTLEQIGAQLGITRERVRQLKVRGLARLREGRTRETLATFAVG